MFPAHHYYYLHNFERALDWLSERHVDLLGDAERQFLTQFAKLPELSRALLVRLLMRRGPWFRESKLEYEEIPDVADAAVPLLALGWLDDHGALELEELFALHTKSELMQMFRGSALRPSMRKPEMLDALRILHNTPLPYARWNPGALESVWRVTVGKVCDRLRLVFFGNLHQQWSEFVLADLGIFKYEAVPLNAMSHAFQKPEDVDQYLFLRACRQALDEGADKDQLLLQVVNFKSCNPWLESRRAKILWRIGQALEREQNWERAEQAYSESHHPGARLRRIRVCERMGRLSEAMALALTAEAAPESEEERQRLARMLPRLRRSTPNCPSTNTSHATLEHTDSLRRTKSADQTLIEFEMELPASPNGVEFAVRDHWNTDTAPVFYVENALINSLFGLLCWPAIFAPLPGAFFHPFQSGPADLLAPDFVSRREVLFTECLDRLRDGTYREIIQQRYESKHGVQSPFVFWGLMSAELLTLALDCIPAHHLGIFFGRILQDIRANRSGFPDLVRFWPAERRYELVEVKGPGDKLQDNQVRWLQYFSEHGVAARVCYVRWRSELACEATP